MAVSVIISNMNGIKFLPRLLQCIRDQRNVKVQIIVVDRLSCDGSKEYLNLQNDVTVVDVPPESGLVSGYAAGVPFALNEHLFFCNEDMWFDLDCFSLLENSINLSEQIVAADPWQWTYDEKHLIHGGVGFFDSFWNPLCPLPKIKYAFTLQMPVNQRIPFACAGAFMIHRQAYEQAGGWDSAFFLDHEDVDLFIRIWQMDKSCVTVPNARVYHAVGSSNYQVIPALNTPVRRRRYISGNASVSIIGIKYFKGIWLLYAYFFPLLAISKELVRFRFHLAWLAILSAIEVMQRYRTAKRFRLSWEKWIRRNPGQNFFLDSNFYIKPNKIKL